MWSFVCSCVRSDLFVVVRRCAVCRGVPRGRCLVRLREDGENELRVVCCCVVVCELFSSKFRINRPNMKNEMRLAYCTSGLQTTRVRMHDASERCDDGSTTDEHDGRTFVRSRNNDHPSSSVAPIIIFALLRRSYSTVPGTRRRRRQQRDGSEDEGRKQWYIGATSYKKVVEKRRTR